jgi:hypothetical protein
MTAYGVFVFVGVCALLIFLLTRDGDNDIM